MKIVLNFLILTLFLHSQETLNSIIEKMYKQLGYKHLKSIVYNAHSIQYHIEQSERQFPPYLAAFSDDDVQIDLISNKKLTRNKSHLFSFTSKTLTSNQASYKIFGKRMIRFQADTELRYLSQIENLYATIKTNNSSLVGLEKLNGVEHFIIETKYNRSRIKTYIQKFSFLPSKVDIEKTFTESFLYVWGRSQKSIYFSFWYYENGIRYPKQIDYFFENKHTKTVSIDSIYFNKELNPGSMPSEPGDELPIRDISSLSVERAKTVEILPGIWQIQSSWNVLFFKNNSDIVVIESPISSKFSGFVKNEIKKTYPSLAIRSLFICSDAYPHYAGVREFIADNVPVFLHETVLNDIKKINDADYSDFPDNLHNNKKEAILNPLKAKKDFDNFTVYPVYGESGERMLMVYFKKEQLLYTADLIQKQRDGSFFQKQYLTEIIDAVTYNHLQVRHVVGMHLKITDYNEILKAVQN